MADLELSGSSLRKEALPAGMMPDAPSGVVLRPVMKVRDGAVTRTEDLVVEEYPLTIYHNDEELVTMLCSPGDEKYLVLGFLASEGVIASPSEINVLDVDMKNGIAWVETSAHSPRPPDMFLKRCLTACCGRGRAGLHFANDAKLVHRVESRVRLSFEDIRRCAETLAALSVTFQATGGVHSGVLFAEGVPVCFCQDIGRHNVLDKLYGSCLDQGIALADLILSFSGRVSSEIVLKVSKMNVPVLVARAAPTSLALGQAEQLGITVVGFARGGGCNVYTHGQRVVG